LRSSIREGQQQIGPEKTSVAAAGSSTLEIPRGIILSGCGPGGTLGAAGDVRQTQISGTRNEETRSATVMVTDRAFQTSFSRLLLFFSRWSARAIAASCIAISRWPVAATRRTLTIPRWSVATLRWTSAVATTSALEAFEHLFQFFAIQCSVFVRVASVEHPLHSLGDFFSAEFAVFVLVEAHHAIKEFGRVTWPALTTILWRTTAFAVASTFAITAWRWTVWTQFVLSQLSVFVLIERQQSLGSVLDFGS
tara:strand:- start:138852 stop:139604 length:753 start_codon:yes stop_codon:yes gene_type:complete